MNNITTGERIIVCFSSWLDSPTGPQFPHCWGFKITIRHTTLSRTPLGEWSARRKKLYLTKHKTHKRHIYAPRGIRTRSSSKRAAADPHFRPCSCWDRYVTSLSQVYRRGISMDSQICLTSTRAKSDFECLVMHIGWFYFSLTNSAGGTRP